MPLLAIDKANYPLLIEDTSGIRHFQSPASERDSIMQHSCCCLLSHFGVLTVSGDDAKTFLQGQLTCDLDLLQDKPQIRGAYCDRKGRVLCNFELIQQQDQYHLIMPTTLLEATSATLNKYGAFSKVSVSIENQWHIIALTPKDKSSTTAQLDLVHRETLQHTWDTLCQQHTPIGLDAWQYWNIQQQRVYIVPATSLRFLPQMLGLEDSVSFNKGCYLGQEIVARTQHLGKLKKRVSKVELAQTVAVGKPVNDDSDDTVVSISAANDGYVALVVTRQNQ